MEQPNQTIASDATIAEIKGWKTSNACTERNEEILQSLQNHVDYCESLLSYCAQIPEANQYNGIITTPEEEAYWEEQLDKDSRECCLAKLKLNAYQLYGVLLSNKDAKKILKKKTAEDIVLDYDKIIENFVREDDSSKNYDMFKFQINNNKDRLKTVLKPYIAPLARAQPVVSTAGQRTRAKKPAGDGTRSSVKSGDGNSSAEPEPPRQLLYTFKSFAQLVDCSEKTLRNKVSAGLFPQPQKTAFGPRFTQQHLDFAVTPVKPASARGRGRPRIADSVMQGGVQ